MIFRTFNAADLTEAVNAVRDRVRESLGPDAVVVHATTRVTRKWLGLRRELSVEITVVKEQSLHLLSSLSPGQPVSREPKHGLN